MIVCYWGEDREGSRRAARAEFVATQKKAPSAPIFEFTGDELSLENLSEAASARPLVGDKIIVFGDHLFVKPLLANFIIDNLSTFQSSDNIFILWEEILSLKIVEEIIKAGGKIKEFKIVSRSPVTESKGESLKIFTLADAVGSRERKRAWLLYHELRRTGLPVEEIFWKLVWKVKTLLLVETASPGSSLPLKPYPLSQARRQVRGYKSGELVRLSARLVHLYHDSRRGRLDFDFALERLLLEL